MSETVEVRNQVRVYVGDPDEAPDGVEVHEYDGDDLPEGNDYYYEVSLDYLAEKIQKRYVYYDGPEGVGYFDTVRKELTVKRVRDDESVVTRDTCDTQETKENAVKKQIFEKADGILEKYKIYISEAETYGEAQEMAPEWADVQVSDQGSFYYEKLPGQGDDDGDDTELTTGDYDVDTQFGRIMADRVLNDNVGDIPVDDFHEYLDEVEDPDLVRDALLAEKNGPDRKTGKQFIEKRARDLDLDINAIYKEEGPDVTKNSAFTSLSDMEVNVDELSDEPVVTPEENDYVDREWSVKSIYETYIQEDKPMPRGMGNPDDIPGGTLTNVLEEEVDDPTVLMDFWEEGNLQVRRDVGEILEEEHDVIPRVETVDSELRFDLDNMNQWMDEDEVQDLEPGDQILMDDFAGGFQEAEVEAVTPTGLEVSSPDGLGATHEISFLDVYDDEYAIASMLENDGGQRGGGMLYYEFPEGLIERVEDDSVLSRATKWEEDSDMDLRPATIERMNRRLSELNPPDPDEYGMDEEAMDMLHGTQWPSWSQDRKAAGNGIQQNLREVYENTTTEDLEKYKEVCEDNDLNDRAKVVNGMLYYREDSDVELTDIVEYERVAHGNYAGVTGDMEERVMGAAEDSFDAMDPHVGAQLSAHIDKFRLQNPDGNWVGQAQNGGRRIAIDNPRDVHKTTAHEMGHALHNFMGIKNDGYGTIDNRDNSNNPDQWEFGAKPPGDDANEDAQKFYDSMKDEWEKYKETKKGERDDAHELRPYQKRHGVELMAVGFGHYVSDPHKIRNRHPGLAEVFDEHVAGGVKGDISVEDVEEGQFYNVAIEGRGRETVEIRDKEVYENGEVNVLVSGAETGSRVHGTEWMDARKLEIEEVSDEYEPLEVEHGKKVTVDIDGAEEDVYIDTKSRVMGGDFRVVNEYGEVYGHLTEDELRDYLVEQTDESIDEMPWHPADAERGDLVEMHGVEVQVRSVDDWDGEVTLEDANGETQTLSFGDVQELRESGDFEPVQSVVDWEEITTGENYSFREGDVRYNGEVVGYDEDEVIIDQGRAGTSTIDRDDIDEINRRL